MSDEYRGKHNGTVKGKTFERTRRERKTHSQRRAERSNYERTIYGGGK